MNLKLYLWLCAGALTAMALGQTARAPLTLTLQDALARAQTNVPQLLAAVSDANAAHEDVLQARAATRPSLSGKSDYLVTQGNGVFPSGRFVTNDGVHVYRDWAVVHQDFTAAVTRTGIKRAAAKPRCWRKRKRKSRAGTGGHRDASLLRAAHGPAQIRHRSAGSGSGQALPRHQPESGTRRRSGAQRRRESANCKYAAQDQAFREAKLAMDNARLDLAVLLFRDFDQNFTLVDDLALAPALPAFAEVQTMAERENPDLRAANSALRGARTGRHDRAPGYLPSLTADFAYGIEANAFALHSTVAADPQKGPLPNLGYFLTVSLNVPVWDWGSREQQSPPGRSSSASRPTWN